MQLRPIRPMHPLSEDDRAFLARGPVWLFDGVCVLCSNAVRFTLENEYPSSTPIRFVAIQSALGTRLATAYGNAPDKPYSFLWFEKGEAYDRTDAVMGLASHMGGRAKLAPMLRFIPRAVRNFLYDRVARNRYSWFGKHDACTVPDAATRARFTLPGD
jgi:predicted DCC family thiol-disulfide oxidoreductase YuxK